MKKVVVPGELIEDKPLHLLDTIIDENKTYATVISVFDDEKKTLVPLEGLWYPDRDEMVVGIIEEAKLNTYTVKLNAPWKGLIISKYAESTMSNGDIIEAYVKELDKTGTVVLSRPRVLSGGKVISIKPSKVRRVLGKSDTMIKQITTGTGTQITAGMNGLVWLKGGNIDKALEAIQQIQDEAHVPGLTERISNMFGKSSAPQQPKM